MHKQRLPGAGPRLAEEVPSLAVAGSLHRPSDLSLHCRIVGCVRAWSAIEACSVRPATCRRCGCRRSPGDPPMLEAGLVATVAAWEKRAHPSTCELTGALI